MRSNTQRHEKDQADTFPEPEWKNNSYCRDVRGIWLQVALPNRAFRYIVVCNIVRFGCHSALVVKSDLTGERENTAGVCAFLISVLSRRYGQRAGVFCTRS